LSKANPHSYFRAAVAVTFGLIILVIIFLLIYGKRNSFLLINGYYNEPLDYFFQYITLLGDGLIYIPIVIYSFVFNRTFLVPLIASIIICTVITYFLKRVVFPDDLRPVSLEMERIILHKIDGVPMRRLHSFPSGHTSTAFTMALLLSSVMKKKFWAFILPVIAFLVGYSRVYLGQHFATDVCAGMAIGIVSAYLSLLIYDRYRERKALKTASLT
jgi:membrane-associated phospholipid phosphatase